jgi:hypothetical protein
MSETNPRPTFGPDLWAHRPWDSTPDPRPMFGPPAPTCVRLMAQDTWPYVHRCGRPAACLDDSQSIAAARGTFDLGGPRTGPVWLCLRHRLALAACLVAARDDMALVTDVRNL